jgi:hypothetical protein
MIPLQVHPRTACPGRTLHAWKRVIARVEGDGAYVCSCIAEGTDGVTNDWGAPGRVTGGKSFHRWCYPRRCGWCRGSTPAPKSTQWHSHRNCWEKPKAAAAAAAGCQIADGRRSGAGSGDAGGRLHGRYREGHRNNADQRGKAGVARRPPSSVPMQVLVSASAPGAELVHAHRPSPALPSATHTRPRPSTMPGPVSLSQTPTPHALALAELSVVVCPRLPTSTSTSSSTSHHITSTSTSSPPSPRSTPPSAM